MPPLASARQSVASRSRTRVRSSLPAAIVTAFTLALTGCGASTTGPGSEPSSATPSVSNSPAVSNSPQSDTLPVATAQKLQQVLDETRADTHSPGVIAGVWSPQGTWIGSAGTKGQGKTGAPTATDHARIGSLTKTMTATVLLQLVEQHKVSLDDTIGKYVPDMPNGNIATLRQLADMSSGIPSYTADPAWQKEAFAHPEKQWSPQDLIAVVRGKKPDFAPGKGWAYSNTNYVLLGLVIEKVTGEPIRTVFEKQLFRPLGMTESSLPVDTNAIPAPRLYGITDQGENDKTVDATNWSPSIAFTAGQVISTLDDLHKWANALFTGKGILTPATQELRRDSIIYGIPPANSPTAGYGIGIGNRNGWWGHDGQIPGYNTALFHNYDLDTTIVVIVNSDATATIDGKQTTPVGVFFARLAAALK
jgi:D-alanyl-D-alanine carboxypeptidase